MSPGIDQKLKHSTRLEFRYKTQADLLVLKMQQMKSNVIGNHLECQLRQLLETVNKEPANQSRTIEELRRTLNE